MKMEALTHRLSNLMCRSAAVALFAGLAPAALLAQQPAVASGNAPAEPGPTLALAETQPIDLAHAAGVSYSSSSPAIEALDLTAADHLNLPAGEATQPPPRRRYGRPRYNDSSHNPDGSSKYAFIAGAGLTLPNGNTYHYLNTDYAFQVGAGRNFNKNLSLLVQFDYDHFGFNGRTLQLQANLYDPTGADGINGNLDGKSHVWSFTLDPTYNIYAREGLGAYVVGGVGFYHKTANFTVPTTGYYYDPYYGAYFPYAANQTIDKYTSNAAGFNGGFGLTYKFSRFSSQRFYVEARYVFVDNQQKPGYNASNPNYNTSYNGNDFYRPNSNRTTYVPIKAGIRF